MTVGDPSPRQTRYSERPSPMSTFPASTRLGLEDGDVSTIEGDPAPANVGALPVPQALSINAVVASREGNRALITLKIMRVPSMDPDSGAVPAFRQIPEQPKTRCRR